MKNKVFLFFICTLTISLFIFPPMKMLLCNLGYMTQAKIGNEFHAELTESTTWYAPIYNAIETAKAGLNDLYCNYLPYYNDLVAFHGSVEQSLNEPVYLLLDHYSQNSTAAAPVIDTLADNSDTSPDNPTDPAAETEAAEPGPDDNIASFKSRFISSDATHRYYLFTATYDDGTVKQALERVAILAPEKLHDRMESSLTEMLRITKYLSEHANVYLYSGSRFQDSPVLNDYLPNEYSTMADRDEYLEAVSEYASVGYLHLDSMNDRFDRMFLTDHHWNAEGMRQGYMDVHAMMKENFPEISDINEPDYHEVEGIKHYGSFARLSNNYTVCEGLSFYDYHLAEHRSSGGSVEDSHEIYLAKRYDNTRGVAHYEAFYPQPTHVTYSENNTGRNLLIIGDSFCRGFTEYIGSHYDSTAFISIWGGNEIALDKVLARYDVTDVLILLYSDRMMYNLYSNDMNLTRYLTPEN